MDKHAGGKYSTSFDSLVDRMSKLSEIIEVVCLNSYRPSESNDFEARRRASFQMFFLFLFEKMRDNSFEFDDYEPLFSELNTIGWAVKQGRINAFGRKESVNAHFECINPDDFSRFENIKLETSKLTIIKEVHRQMDYDDSDDQSFNPKDWIDQYVIDWYDVRLCRPIELILIDERIISGMRGIPIFELYERFILDDFFVQATRTDARQSNAVFAVAESNTKGLRDHFGPIIAPSWLYAERGFKMAYWLKFRKRAKIKELEGGEYIPKIVGWFIDAVNYPLLYVVDLLQNEGLYATGFHLLSGEEKRIPANFWSRRDIEIDFSNGHVFDSQGVTIWEHVILHVPVAISGLDVDISANTSKKIDGPNRLLPPTKLNLESKKRERSSQIIEQIIDNLLMTDSGFGQKNRTDQIEQIISKLKIDPRFRGVRNIPSSKSTIGPILTRLNPATSKK